MTLRGPGRRGLAVLSVLLLCAACNGTGIASSPPAAGAPTPSIVAPATAPGTPATTARATPAASASASPAPPSRSATEPPPATLAAEGGDPVTGQLGSYTWAGGGSDSPWLPGAPIHVGTGERLTVRIGDGVGVTGWTAHRVPPGSTDGSGAVALGSGGGPLVFAAPPAGSWSVQVAVRFSDGLGSATYYWHLDVT